MTNASFKQIDDDVYPSQQIITQEKLVYLLYQGIHLLKELYKKGIAHGGLNSVNLKITDEYALKIEDFELACYIPNFESLSPEE